MVASLMSISGSGTGIRVMDSDDTEISSISAARPAKAEAMAIMSRRTFFFIMRIIYSLSKNVS